MIDTPDIALDALEGPPFLDRVIVARQMPSNNLGSGDRGYAPEAPNVFMPPHDGSIPDGARLSVSVALNIETTIAGVVPSERDQITLIMGVAILEFDQSGSVRLGGATYAPGTLYSHVFASPVSMTALAGRKLYGTSSWSIDLVYRADRRYLVGFTLGDPASGSPPAGWTHMVLPGSFVQIRARKTQRG